MHRLLVKLICCGLLALPLVGNAMGAKPEPMNREEAALIGLYAGPGAGFAIRENKGNLEMLYPNLRKPDPKDKDAENSVLPLKRSHYDEYTFQDLTPKFTTADTLNFDRDKEGRGVSVRLGEMNYNRRFTNGEDGKPFRIKVAKDVETLRKEAVSSSVPKHPYAETAQLVELSTIVPELHYDLRYTTANNLFGVPVVLSKQAYLDRVAAQKLASVNEKLKAYGYGLLVWEAYRSWADFKLSVLLLDNKHKNMLPKAEQGFSHNTGRSIAVSLYDRATGEAVQMISDFDEITPAQYADYLGGTSLQRWQRDLLREQMENEGFTGSKTEWWHFDYNAKVKYQLLNETVK